MFVPSIYAGKHLLKPFNMKLKIVPFFLFATLFISAQSVPEQLKSVEKLYKQSYYKEAIASTDNLKKQIEADYLQSIKDALLPAKIDDFSPVKSALDTEGEMMIEYNMMSSSSYISGNKIQVTQTYQQKQKEKTEVVDKNEEQHLEEGEMFMEEDMFYEDFFNQPQITITISNAPDKIYEITSAYLQQVDNTMPEQNYTPFLFNDYRAVSTYNQEMKQGHLMMIIGAAVIDISTSGLENDELQKIARLINIEKVINYFGK